MIGNKKQQTFLPEDLGAIIVTYHPNQDFPHRLKRILHQVSMVLIVDNASNQKAKQMLYKEADRNNNVEIIENNKNYGIAKALNQGMQWIKKKGYHWALTLDQDTVPSVDQVMRLIDAYASAFSRYENIAIVGSNYCDINDNKLNKVRYNQKNAIIWKERKTVITSGSLISMVAFEKIGPFREDFFMDHVDHEYCLRARSKGFKIIVALKAIMEHSIGEQSEHRLIFLKIKISNHSAKRNYYRSRNGILLMREYIIKEPVFMLKMFIIKLRTIFFICIFEKEKLKKLEYIIRGYRDGIMKKEER